MILIYKYFKRITNPRTYLGGYACGLKENPSELTKGFST